jgi:hypothetical protein
MELQEMDKAEKKAQKKLEEQNAEEEEEEVVVQIDHGSQGGAAGAAHQEMQEQTTDEDHDVLSSGSVSSELLNNAWEESNSIREETLASQWKNKSLWNKCWNDRSENVRATPLALTTRCCSPDRCRRWNRNLRPNLLRFVRMRVRSCCSGRGRICLRPMMKTNTCPELSSISPSKKTRGCPRGYSFGPIQ